MTYNRTSICCWLPVQANYTGSIVYNVLYEHGKTFRSSIFGGIVGIEMCTSLVAPCSGGACSIQCGAPECWCWWMVKHINIKHHCTLYNGTWFNVNISSSVKTIYFIENKSYNILSVWQYWQCETNILVLIDYNTSLVSRYWCNWQ